jgi:hypothetical protein
MGVKKAKKATKAKKSGGVAKVAKTAVSALSGIKGKASTGGRRRRMTPESLSRQILILKLKKRLFRMKYGGR